MLSTVFMLGRNWQFLMGLGRDTVSAIMYSHCCWTESNGLVKSGMYSVKGSVVKESQYNT